MRGGGDERGVESGGVPAMGEVAIKHSPYKMNQAKLTSFIYTVHVEVLGGLGYSVKCSASHPSHAALSS